MIPKGDPTAINPFQKMFSKGDLKTMRTADAIGQIVEIASSVAGGVASINDFKKAQQFQNYLSNLSDDQQQALINSIDKAKTEEDTYRIISAVIQNAQAKRVQNLAGVIIQQEQINRNIRIEKIVIMSLLGVLAIALIYSRKKQ
jgi:hypothetical protein